uniref:Uncharacterized protein n=1 Tax=Erpetoichthys calabaricus TaxID=27687 RepID=A0A8C4RY84_ERPCA
SQNLTSLQKRRDGLVHHRWCYKCSVAKAILTSLGRREMKSRWNCGSITCIMCFTCVGSQLSISSSRASSFSGPLHTYTKETLLLPCYDKGSHSYPTVFLAG